MYVEGDWGGEWQTVHPSKEKFEGACREGIAPYYDHIVEGVDSGRKASAVVEGKETNYSA